jgi:hypothetical protein
MAELAKSPVAAPLPAETSAAQPPAIPSVTPPALTFVIPPAPAEATTSADPTPAIEIDALSRPPKQPPRPETPTIGKSDAGTLSAHEWWAEWYRQQLDKERVDRKAEWKVFYDLGVEKGQRAEQP